ncbi:MAG: peptide deformylase [Ruminococcaceae bacterium]|nr:peptide deformylase [Oscillospiraceae bacterium]
MAIRMIRTVPDEVLTKKCREVTEFDQRLFTLLDDMYDTMKEKNGVGLAAPQVGILRRVAVIDIGEGKIELVNPKIIARSKETEVTDEGCLSLPGAVGSVERPKSVTVIAQDRNGKEFQIVGKGLLARAFCHEIDHLDGVMYTTHVQGEIHY